jgi:hypothetical protein
MIPLMVCAFARLLRSRRLGQSPDDRSKLAIPGQHAPACPRFQYVVDDLSLSGCGMLRASGTSDFVNVLVLASQTADSQDMIAAGNHAF